MFLDARPTCNKNNNKLQCINRLLAFLAVGKIVLVNANVFTIFYIVGLYCCMVYSLSYLGEFSYKV